VAARSPKPGSDGVNGAGTIDSPSSDEGVRAGCWTWLHLPSRPPLWKVSIVAGIGASVPRAEQWRYSDALGIITAFVGSSLLLVLSLERRRLGQVRRVGLKRFNRLVRNERLVALLWAGLAAWLRLGPRAGAIGALFQWGVAACDVLIILLFVLTEGAVVRVLEAASVPGMLVLIGSRPGWACLRSNLSPWDVPETDALRKRTARFFGPRWGRVSKLTVRLAILMALTAGNAFGTAAGSTLGIPHSSPNPANTSGSHHREAQVTHVDPPVSPALTVPQKEPILFSEVCGSRPIAHPGEGAGWASQDLWDLYFKPGHGVGAVVAGCPQPVVRVTDAGDSVVYQEGFDSSGLRSVVLDSTRHGPVLFLDQAATVVDTLLRSDVAASGSAREDIANGDLQLVYTPAGTISLVRGRKVAPFTANQSEPYTELSPSFTLAWVGAMTKSDRWLWPRDSSDQDGKPVILLSDRVDGPPVATISAGTGDVAELVASGVTKSFISTGTHLTIRTVLNASSAR
jgi:hypothetical protein